MNLTELRRLAEAANVIDHNENPSWYSEEELHRLFEYPKNYRFIAAANPATVLKLLDENEVLRKDVVQLKELLPKRIPNGFVSFGKNYAEQEDKFADPYNKMSKFKKQYLEDCAAAMKEAK